MLFLVFEVYGQTVARVALPGYTLPAALTIVAEHARMMGGCTPDVWIGALEGTEVVSRIRLCEPFHGFRGPFLSAADYQELSSAKWSDWEKDSVIISIPAVGALLANKEYMNNLVRLALAFVSMIVFRCPEDLLGFVEGVVEGVSVKTLKELSEGQSLFVKMPLRSIVKFPLHPGFYAHAGFLGLAHTHWDIQVRICSREGELGLILPSAKNIQLSAD